MRNLVVFGVLGIVTGSLLAPNVFAEGTSTVKKINLGGIDTDDCMSSKEAFLAIADVVRSPSLKLTAGKCMQYSDKDAQIHERAEAYGTYATLDSSNPLKDAKYGSFPSRVANCNDGSKDALVNILNSQLDSAGVSMRLSYSCSCNRPALSLLPPAAGEGPKCFEQLHVQTWSDSDSE